MGNFLKKFSGTLQNRQVQQILKSLNERKVNGEFENSLKFQSEFERLLNNLASDEAKSSLITYPAIALELTNTEQFNDMLTKTYQSLEASFEELEKIEEVQTNHQNIIKEVILKNINLSINELKTKLNLYKFINNNNHGFEDSIYSTFGETKEERVNRGSEISNTLFVDPRTKKVLDSSFDAEIDPIDESLQLNSLNKKEIKITNVTQEWGGSFKTSLWIYFDDPDVEHNENSGEYDYTGLDKITDSLNNTYWKQIIRTVNKNEEIKVKLVLQLAGTREINYLEIDSVGNSKLEKIDYINDLGASVSILGANESVDLKTQTKVSFSKISTEKIYLEFNLNSTGDKKEIIKEAFEKNAILNNFVSEFSKNELLEQINNISNKYEYYEYEIGIDNIRVGMSEYQKKSVYTSNRLFMKDETGILGLTGKERRPYLDGDVLKFSSNENRNYLSSLEYWVIKEDLDNDLEDSADLIKTQIFPILPIGTTNIYQERLVLSESSNNLKLDTGELIHFPDLSGSNVVSLYRNNSLMTTSEYSVVSNASPGNGSKMNYKIIVLGVNPGDIFTASYVPLTGNSYSRETGFTNIKQVDLVGDLTARVGPEGVILLDESADQRIESYRIYLMVIIRQNTGKKNITGFLDEYRLSTGKRNLLKFEGTP